MTWRQLADEVTTMMISGQLREPIQFDAAAAVAVRVALGFGGEEAPVEYVSAIGVKNYTAGLERFGRGRKVRNGRRS
jgi:hypothetical protein